MAFPLRPLSLPLLLAVLLAQLVAAGAAQADDPAPAVAPAPVTAPAPAPEANPAAPVQPSTIDLPNAPLRARSDALVVRVQPGVTVEGAQPLTNDGRIVSVDTTAAGAATLAADPRVASVEPDRLMHWADDAKFTLNSVTNDPLIGDEWMLSAIGWFQSPFTPDSPTIAFLDSGIDVHHPDMAGTLPDGRPKLAAVWSSVTSDADVADDFGHGTATSSVAAALTNNGEGLASIAPGSQVMMVKVGGVWGVRVSDAVAGVTWAVSHGARIINISFASPDESPAMRAAVEDAVTRNIAVVAAVGNEGCAAEGGGNQLQYPAGYPHVIGVAATNSSGRVSCFSNYGKEVDIAAPGENLQLAVPKGTKDGTLYADSGYRSASGTSFAAPIVAAAMALVAGQHPDWSPDQLATALTRTAKDIDAPGRDLRSGAGLLNLSAALADTTVPPRDFRETNDDVRAAARYAPLLTQSRRTVAIAATIDPANDPSDVYGITLRRGAKLRVNLVGASSASRFHLTLWKAGTRTVTAVASRSDRNVAGVSIDRTHRSTLTVTVAKGGTYWVQVTPTRGGGAYSMSLNAR